jgi:hypothetical protein
VNNFYNCSPFNYIQARRLVVNFINKNNFTYGDEYDIPIEITTTFKGELFLHFDSGLDDVSRILIFTTDENLRHLSLNIRGYVMQLSKVPQVHILSCLLFNVISEGSTYRSYFVL